MTDSLFRCPVCGGALFREAHSYRCAAGHSYDIAKEGYTYLLPPIRSTPPTPATTRPWPPPGGISYPQGIIGRC